MCKTLGVSYSGYHDGLDRPACPRAQANVVLLEQIRQAHRASDATYGMPRIQAELADQGVSAGRTRIAHLMRTVGLRGVSRWRAWCVTTKRGKVGRRHTAALSEPASSNGLGHTGDRGCVLAGVPLRNKLPKRQSLGAM